MRNIKLVIEYDGKDFNGWQKQPNKLNIQGEIEKVIYSITGEEVNLIASGRTDAGVHAIGQVANFKTNSNIPIDKIGLAINSRLKKSIVIKDVEEVDERFHSRYGTAIYRNLEYHFPVKLNVNDMKKAIKFFEGEHDFKAFKASGTSSKSSVRTIFNTNLYEKDDRIYIELTGNGFLYNMVRIISGTLLEVGLGKIRPYQIKEIIESKDRENAGRTLPSQGLYLVRVEYDEK